MGFLSKTQTAPFELVAEALATIILRESSRRKVGEVFAGTLRDQEEIDAHARRELLVLKMFCATRAASEILSQPGATEKLLDLLHEKIFASECTSHDRENLEEHLHNRYKSYHNILGSFGDFAPNEWPLAGQQNSEVRSKQSEVFIEAERL